MAAVKFQLIHCAQDCARQLSGNILEVCRSDNVVTVEDITSFMPSYLHRYALGNSYIHHISDRCPPEIMPQHPRTTSLQTSRLPCFFKISDSLAAMCTPQMREEVGDDGSGLMLQCPYAVKLYC
jgi:hypothetical protein